MTNENNSQKPGNKKKYYRRRKPRNYKKQSPKPDQNKQDQSKKAKPNTRSTDSKDRKHNDPTRQNRSQNQRVRKGQNRNSRRRSGQSRDILSSYTNHLNNYIIARKSFFQQFRGNLNKKVKKALDHYTNQLKTLRSFEANLKPWQKERLDKRVNAFAQDTQFSTEHPDLEIISEEEKTSNFRITYNHELISQEERTKFSGDTEETTGTMEDYHKYKDEIMR